MESLTIPNLLSASSTAVTELDGKPVEQFDLIDHFIARYGINLTAEEVMAMDSVVANMLLDRTLNAARHRAAHYRDDPRRKSWKWCRMNVVEMMMV